MAAECARKWHLSSPRRRAPALTYALTVSLVPALVFCSMRVAGSTTTSFSAIHSFTASDKGGAPGINDGDTLTVRFSLPISNAGGEPPPITSKTEIDAFFGFSTPIASDYTGEWSDDRKSAIITVLDVREDSDPIRTYFWRNIGNVFYNATSKLISTMLFSPSEPKLIIMPTDTTPRLFASLSVGDLIRIQGRPSQGVRVESLNISTVNNEYVTINTSYGTNLTVLDPASMSRPAYKNIKQVQIEKAYLSGVQLPPYRSPRYLTDIGRLVVTVNCKMENSETSLQLLPLQNNQTTMRKEVFNSVAVLNGTYGVPKYVAASGSGINATNESYYRLALTGDGIVGGCVAADGGGVSGISVNDTVDLVFGNRTAAPTSPIGLNLGLGIDKDGIYTLSRLSVGRERDGNNLKGSHSIKTTANLMDMRLSESTLPQTFDFVETTLKLINKTEVMPLQTNISSHYLNVNQTKTIPGALAVETLCRFRIAFTLGRVTVYTGSLSVLDSLEKIRHAIEDLTPFGKGSVDSATYISMRNGGGWSLMLSSTCAFCKGKLRMDVHRDFIHRAPSFNVTVLHNNSVSYKNATNIGNSTENDAPYTLITLQNASCPLAGANNIIPSTWGDKAATPSHATNTWEVDDHIYANPDGMTVEGPLVEQLFAFSSPISTSEMSSLTGTWISASRLRLRIGAIDEGVDPFLTGVGRMDNPVRIGKLSVILKPGVSDTLLTDGEYFEHKRPNVSHKPCVLTGTWGEHERLRVVEVRASDTNDPPVNGFSNGDAIALTFSMPTNMPPVGTKEDIDALLNFGGYLLDKSGASLKLFRCPKQCLYPGKDYKGKWISKSKLLIRITDSTLEKTPGRLEATGDTIEYDEEAGVSPERQIKIKPQETSMSFSDFSFSGIISGKTAAELYADGLEGGFAVYVKENAGLSTEDESAPPCLDVSKGSGQFCGDTAIGNWGETANMFSVVVLFYGLALAFFGCALLWIFGKTLWLRLM